MAVIAFFSVCTFTREGVDLLSESCWAEDTQSAGCRREITEYSIGTQISLTVWLYCIQIEGDCLGTAAFKSIMRHCIRRDGPTVLHNSPESKPEYQIAKSKISNCTFNRGFKAGFDFSALNYL